MHGGKVRGNDVQHRPFELQNTLAHVVDAGIPQGPQLSEDLRIGEGPSPIVRDAGEELLGRGVDTNLRERVVDAARVSQIVPQGVSLSGDLPPQAIDGQDVVQKLVTQPVAQGDQGRIRLESSILGGVPAIAMTFESVVDVVKGVAAEDRSGSVGRSSSCRWCERSSAGRTSCGASSMKAAYWWCRTSRALIEASATVSCRWLTRDDLTLDMTPSLP